MSASRNTGKMSNPGRTSTRSSRKRIKRDRDDEGEDSPVDQPESIANGPSTASRSREPVQRTSSSNSQRRNRIPPPDSGNSHRTSPLAENNATASTRATTSPNDTASTVSAAAAAAAPPQLKEMIGYCFCRDWRIIIRDPVAGVVVCHCKDCQAISSSFFCTYVTAKSRALLTVEPTDRTARNVLSSTYYYTIMEGENTGKRQSRTFCSRCGAVLFATPESLEGALPINRNLFLTPENTSNPAVMEILTPKMEIFTRDRNDWRPGDKGIVHQWDEMPSHL